MDNRSKALPDTWATPQREGVRVETPNPGTEVVDLSPPGADHRLMAVVKKGSKLTPLEIWQVRQLVQRVCAKYDEPPV